MLDTDIDESTLKEINEKHGTKMVQIVKNVIELLTSTLSGEIMSKCDIINWDEGVTLDWRWYALHISNNDPTEYAIQVYNYFRPIPKMYILTIYTTFKAATNALIRIVTSIDTYKQSD